MADIVDLVVDIVDWVAGIVDLDVVDTVDLDAAETVVDLVGLMAGYSGLGFGTAVVVDVVGSGIAWAYFGAVADTVVGLPCVHACVLHHGA